MIEVLKASGLKEEFNKKKIENTAIKAGASKNLAKEIANKISKEIKQGDSTTKILNKVLQLLKSKPEIAARYDLKRAIMSLGPHGFLFEEYFAQILQNYGYKTKVGAEVKGKVIMQEIDIIAQKNKTIMIETKYHNQLGVHTNTKVAMYTYARFLDINSNPKNKFDESWLVTNTKCTPNAVSYSKGINQKIISWQYPKKGNLQDLIKEKGLYPITIFKSITDQTKEKLFRAKIVIAKDLIKYNVDELNKKTGLNKDILNKILDESKKIINN